MLKTQNRLDNGRGKFCSKNCRSKYYSQKHIIGFKLKNSIGIKNLKRGGCGLSGEKNPMWKGEDVGYKGLHSWVTKKLGNPSFCEICKSTKKKKYEWANTNHLYQRNLKDWKRLCCGCHQNFDRENGIRKIRQNYTT